MRLAALTCVELFGNPALSWPDLALLREWTTLPIVLKGICHPEDARAALDAGMDGVIVSNHGGRQVDGARAALDCLPDVVAAVDGRAGAARLGDSVRRGRDNRTRARCAGRPARTSLGVRDGAGRPR